jgi:hypothetical protein
MEQVVQAISDPVLAGFLAASVRLSVPILLVALGGMFSEKSGVLNIGLEGMMLIGCFVGFIVAYATGNLWLGVRVRDSTTPDHAVPADRLRGAGAGADHRAAVVRA